jgi:hypothetical protein
MQLAAERRAAAAESARVEAERAPQLPEQMRVDDDEGSRAWTRCLE